MTRRIHAPLSLLALLVALLGALSVASPAEAQTGPARLLGDPANGQTIDRNSIFGTGNESNSIISEGNEDNSVSPSTPFSYALALDAPDPSLEGEGPWGDVGEGFEEGEGEEPGAPWSGPKVQLYYTTYRINDGFGGGDVHGGGMEGFIPIPIPQVRLSLGAEAGIHGYSLGGQDFVARAVVAIGYQHTGDLDPVLPYARLVLTGGLMAGSRYETRMLWGLYGGGLEIGAEVHILNGFHAGIGLAYLRMNVDGYDYDLFQLRLAVGL